MGWRPQRTDRESRPFWCFLISWNDDPGKILTVMFQQQHHHSEIRYTSVFVILNCAFKWKHDAVKQSAVQCYQVWRKTGSMFMVVALKRCVCLYQSLDQDVKFGFCCLTTQTTGSTVWSTTCWWQMIITPYGSICSLYSLDAWPSWFSHMWAKMVSADPVLLLSLVLKRLEKKGNKLCNEVWRYWCNWLHLNRLPSGSRSNNILPETPLKMSSLDTNWQNQRGRRPLYHCTAFKSYQCVTEAWMEADSRGDRDVSFCRRHSNEVWRRQTQH